MSKKTSEPDDFPEAAWKEMWKAHPYALGVKAWGCRNVALAAARWGYSRRGERLSAIAPGSRDWKEAILFLGSQRDKAEAARDVALERVRKLKETVREFVEGAEF